MDQKENYQSYFPSCAHSPLSLICVSEICGFLRICKNCLISHIRTHTSKSQDSNILKISEPEFNEISDKIRSQYDFRGISLRKIDDAMKYTSHYSQEINLNFQTFYQRLQSENENQMKEKIEILQKNLNSRKERIHSILKNLTEFSDIVEDKLNPDEIIMTTELNGMEIESNEISKGKLDFDVLDTLVKKFKRQFSDSNKYKNPRIETIERVISNINSEYSEVNANFEGNFTSVKEILNNNFTEKPKTKARFYSDKDSQNENIDDADVLVIEKKIQIRGNYPKPITVPKGIERQRLQKRVTIHKFPHNYNRGDVTIFEHFHAEDKELCIWICHKTIKHDDSRLYDISQYSQVNFQLKRRIIIEDCVSKINCFAFLPEYFIFGFNLYPYPKTIEEELRITNQNSRVSNGAFYQKGMKPRYLVIKGTNMFICFKNRSFVLANAVDNQVSILHDHKEEVPLFKQVVYLYSESCILLATPQGIYIFNLKNYAFTQIFKYKVGSIDIKKECEGKYRILASIERSLSSFSLTFETENKLIFDTVFILERYSGIDYGSVFLLDIDIGLGFPERKNQIDHKF